jgi:plasmid stabilization system protein ParE
VSARVILRPDVPDDLHDIVKYLDRHSVTAGDRFMAAVFPAFDDLAAMPGVGSPKLFRNKRLAGIRSWAVPGFPNHLILYRVAPGGIEVFAVTHGSRRLASLLGKRV